ncbi:CapA family protein [soil metagenome]
MKKIFFLLLILPFTVRSQDTLKISLLFTGDIMQHDSQITAAHDPSSGKYDYKPCFQYVKPILAAPDLTFGNLEVTLAGPPYKGFPQFSAPDELLDALRDAGYDVLVTANNHCVDRGKRGLERTIELLDQSEVLHTGTFKDSSAFIANNPLIIESKGFRFSLLNYTYGTNGLAVYSPNIVNRIDTVQIRKDIQKARTQNTDATIIFMHWGQEYQNLPNAVQRKLADFCFKLGVKIVIGAHPHVLQPMEWRKEKDQLVVYSLGNFVSGQRDRYKNGGAMIHIDLQKIIQPDKTSSVSLKDVTYSLVGVSRAADVKRTYYIVPLEQFEQDSTIVSGRTSQELIRVFGADSRALYSKENKNVSERGK